MPVRKFMAGGQHELEWPSWFNRKIEHDVVDLLLAERNDDGQQEHRRTKLERGGIQIRSPDGGSSHESYWSDPSRVKRAR